VRYALENPVENLLQMQDDDDDVSVVDAAGGDGVAPAVCLYRQDNGKIVEWNLLSI